MRDLKRYIRIIYRKLQSIFGQVDFVPSGHFYSPIANKIEIEEGINNINYDPKSLLGINLNIDEQLKLLKIFGKFYKDIPFKENKGNQRYYFNNDAYCHSDAICLYSMIRHLKPKNIIEVGSGFSSALIHDVNELYFKWGGENKGINIIHIEPYPALLKKLLKPNDFNDTLLYENRLQEVDVNIFCKLENNDILFIDSTHISKINSDVNKIFFEILPRLNSGVYIHFHDIFYPFTYPSDWLREKNSWNESYILRAFLQFNSDFEIVFFNTCINTLYENDFINTLPLSEKNRGGSIWIRRK